MIPRTSSRLFHVADNAETALISGHKNRRMSFVLDVLPGMAGYKGFHTIRQNALAPTSRDLANLVIHDETRSEVMERGFQRLFTEATQHFDSGVPISEVAQSGSRETGRIKRGRSR